MIRAVLLCGRSVLIRAVLLCGRSVLIRAVLLCGRGVLLSVWGVLVHSGGVLLCRRSSVIL